MSAFDEQLARFRQTVRDAEGWSQAAQSVYGEIGKALADTVQLLEDAQRLFEREREARITAERNMQRFRYALWVYLQERDGAAGVHAPTPETLKLIRELVTELASTNGGASNH